MAAITISSPGGAQTNPTDTVLPFNNGGVFGDSMLKQETSSLLYTTYSASTAPEGIEIDNGTGSYRFGDIDGNFAGNAIQITPDGNITTNSSILILSADNEIQLNGLITAVGAGGSAGLHLELTINGTKYKIQLLNV
jgi:hypothetical protein